MKGKACVTIPLLLVALASGARTDTVTEHRRSVRLSVERSTGTDVPARYLSDPDPIVRRYALYKVWERDRTSGCRMAERMKKDKNVHVSTLVRDILEPDREVSKLRSNVPLSQDPSVDHEILRVKSFTPKNGRVMLPEKPKCDSVELWFGRKPATKVIVHVNGKPLYEYDPKRDADRAFRADVTDSVRWGGENVFEIVDASGKPVDDAFTVEVLVCGN